MPCEPTNGDQQSLRGGVWGGRGRGDNISAVSRGLRMIMAVAIVMMKAIIRRKVQDTLDAGLRVKLSVEY